MSACTRVFSLMYPYVYSVAPGGPIQNKVLGNRKPDSVYAYVSACVYIYTYLYIYIDTHIASKFQGMYYYLHHNKQ